MDLSAPLARRAIAGLVGLVLIVSLGVGPSIKGAVAGPPGDWRLPLSSATVVGSFDPPEQRWAAGHRGVDLDASPGTVVTAAGAGVVAFSGTVVDRPVVSVDHGSIRTTYEPVTSTLSPGAVVAAGTALGQVAAGGHCSDRCMHWGAIFDGEYIDPLLLLRDYTPVLKTPRPGL